MTEAPPSFEELMHFGVKGMKWGVRDDDQSVEANARRAKYKKAAIILGSAAAIAAVAGGAYYVHKNYNVNVSSLAKSAATTDKGKTFAQAFSKEPVGIVHAARGRSRGFTFPGHGGLDSPLSEYTKAFGSSEDGGANFVRRYGTQLEKVASRFLDPEGRLDQSGRPIFHEVMLPAALAKGVETESDVVRVAWPLIKDTYAALYGS